MKELYSCFNGYRKQLVLGPLFKLTEAILELMVPLLMADIIDVGIRNGDRSYVVTHGLFMLLLGAIGLGCAMICQYFAAVCAQGFGRSLRQKLFRHVFSLSQKEYGAIGTDSLITRLTSCLLYTSRPACKAVWNSYPLPAKWSKTRLHSSSPALLSWQAGRRRFKAE